MGETVMTKCWDSSGKKVLTYFLPSDVVIKPSHPFYERIQMYESDVAFHKRQVDKEVVEWWKIYKKYKLPKDIFQLIKKEYLHRPVKYKCHVTQEEEEENVEIPYRCLVIYFLIMIVTLLVIIILIMSMTPPQSADPFVYKCFGESCAGVPGPQGPQGQCLK